MFKKILLCLFLGTTLIHSDDDDLVNLLLTDEQLGSLDENTETQRFEEFCLTEEFWKSINWDGTNLDLIRYAFMVAQNSLSLNNYNNTTNIFSKNR